MSILDLDKIDAIHRDAGGLVLTIADHLDWSDVHAHLVALQEKIQVYVNFIEGDEIEEHRIADTNETVMIDVVMKFPPIEDIVDEFFDAVRALLAKPVCRPSCDGDC